MFDFQITLLNLHEYVNSAAVESILKLEWVSML
jgi:hypothetical protein